MISLVFFKKPTRPLTSSPLFVSDTFSRAFAAFPGDRVSLGCGKLGLAGSYEVVSARSRLDEDGERTEIVLSVR